MPLRRVRKHTLSGLGSSLWFKFGLVPNLLSGSLFKVVFDREE